MTSHDITARDKLYIFIFVLTVFLIDKGSAAVRIFLTHLHTCKLNQDMENSNFSRDGDESQWSTEPEEVIAAVEERLAPYYQSGELVKSNVCRGYYTVRDQSKTKGFVVETKNASLASLYLQPAQTSHEWRTGSVFGWTKPRCALNPSKSGRPEWQRTWEDLRGRQKEEFDRIISLVIE
jgi:hypothetical protein